MMDSGIRRRSMQFSILEPPEKSQQMLFYSSTSSTRAVRSRFTGVTPGVDVGSAEVVVADGAVSVAGADVDAALDFLLFLLFLLCRSGD